MIYFHTVKNKTRLTNIRQASSFMFSLYTYTHTPTELFVRMMMVMMCNDILHFSLL